MTIKQVTTIVFRRTTCAYMALAVAIAIFVVHVLSIAFITDETERDAADNILDVIEGTLAAIAVLYVANQRAVLSKRTSMAWRLIGLGLLSYTTGDFLRAYIEPTLNLDPYLSIADAGRLGYYLLFLVGLIVLSRLPLTRTERFRLLCDLGIAIVASGMLFGRIFFEPLLSDTTVEPNIKLFLLIYPVLDWMLIWGTSSIILRRTETRNPLLLLALSALTLGIANLLFNFEMIANTNPGRLVLTEAAYSLSLLLAAFAAVLQIASSQTPATFLREDARLNKILVSIGRVQSALATFMPFFWIGLAFILTMDAIGPVLVSSPNTTFTWSITGLGLMILLVLLRQAIAFSENANLSSRLARLLNTSRVLGEPSTTTSLPNLILPQIQQLLPADQICIVLLREQNHADIYRWTDPADKREPEHILVSAEIMPVFNTTLPIALTRPFAAWHMPIVTWLISAAAKPAVFNSVLIAPMKSNNRAVGLIVVGHGTPNCYSEEDAETLIAFAHQAGATVENVHLRRQEALAAAQAERSRLARELHDSVSQTLFGIALGARTAQELITTDTTRTQDALDYVVNLVDGAQAETKALIYELRPEILATEGLLTALHMQSESLCKRHGLLINFRAACDEPDISLRTKEALYRISMEAIQNTIRHASAGVVNISIERQTEHLLKLCIQDDGRGFDTQATYPGHFGLHTMRERAEGIGAHLSVASSPMQGTTLCVITPV